ncbi:uncharacterized protein LOC124911815 [Impatiens glandulifera]|uniref:uncharacterized protein LOC124911815 n=1 Tax=Impatiens glandulifera TaxID=253017 RepID=UPI001FB0E916|nr:uncharacterized protein LOC124911815 [Impatiens glandulifera]
MLLVGKRSIITLTNCSKPLSAILHQRLHFSSKKSTSSFTVSYLISSCGFSPEAALRASKTIQFKSAEQPDSVITLLKSHGFSDTQISKLTNAYPRLLLSNPSNTISPKLEFFTSLGIPTDVLTKSFSSTPLLFRASLDNRIRPAYNFLKDILLLDDEKVKQLFATSPWMFREDPVRCLFPKIAFLRKTGVPLSKLSYLFTDSCRQSSLLQSHGQYEKAVKKVVELGFSPSMFLLVPAIHAVSGLSDSAWNDKIKAFKKYGWSEDNIRLAFLKQPQILSMSEQKISSTMDFFVSGLGMKPRAIAKTPWILIYSLENRIIPRCTIFSLLKSKGLLLIHKVNISTLLVISDNDFLVRYVRKYENILPQLFDIFQGRSDDEFSFASYANIRYCTA